MTKDDRAKTLIEAEIRKGWPDIVESIEVTPRIDFLGEAAFDVLIGLKSIRLSPSSVALGDMLARLSDVLKEASDERATHIGFYAADEADDTEVDDEDELLGSRR